MLQFWAAFLVVTASLPVLLFVWSTARGRHAHRKRASGTTKLDLTVPIPEPSLPVLVHTHRLVGETAMSAVANPQRVGAISYVKIRDDGTRAEPREPVTNRNATEQHADAYWSLIQSNIDSPRTSSSRSGW
jgi:hypothetical protein